MPRIPEFLFLDSRFLFLDMNDIKYKGAKIHFSAVGDGDKIPLILLHGFLEDSLIWKPMLKVLQKDRQVICIDLPGHGRSEGVSEVHSMDLMAEVVKKILEHLKIESVSLAGHSMGGYVGLELLKNFPMLLKSILLINSTPIEDSVEKKKIRDRSINLVGKNMEAFISMAISNLYTVESKVKFASEIQNLKNRAMNMEPENVQAALAGMKIRPNYLEELKAFPGQKIIVAGKQDPILDNDELAEIAQKCNCEFHLMEKGHNSYMEDMNNLRTIMHFID